MKPVFVDANVFLRFFTKDDTAQHAARRETVSSGAEGRTALVSGSPVLFEGCLRRLRAALTDRILASPGRAGGHLALPGLFAHPTPQCAPRRRVFARYSGVDFPDAYIAALPGHAVPRQSPPLIFPTSANLRALATRCDPRLIS